MLRPRDCPDVESWHVLLGSTVAPEQRAAFERHLESCAVCQKRLDCAAELGDALQGLARYVGDPTLAPDPTVARVVERLHEVASPFTARAAGVVELDFLQRQDRPGVLGTLDQYEVQEVIGRGGMGIVLKAFDPALHRLVAIKVMAAALAASATARRRFTREAQAVASISHDHVVTVHGVHEAAGLPYLVMQYVAGESLQARLDRVGPLEVMEVVRIGMQTAAGLAAAHAQGLIHRDVKPANLLLENGLAKVKITDFGLARAAGEFGLTESGVVAGTPEYMAPEQARGEPVDHRADLFSLGSVMYAMCTGVPPFRAASAVAVLRRVSDEQPAPVRSLNPEVPAWLAAVIARLMTKDLAHRFQSAAEVACLLEGYLAHLRQPDSLPAPELPFSGAAKPVEPAQRPPSAQPLRNTSPAPWLLTLLPVATTALAILLWHVVGRDVANPAAQGDEKPARQERLFFDFREPIAKLPPCTLFGPALDSVVTTDAKGLRIARPADLTNQIIGVDVPVVLRGDFDVGLGYELLAVGAPLPTYGAGVALRVVFEDPSSLTAVISRSRKQAGDQFGTYKVTTGADGNDRYAESLEMPAVAQAGRLRLVRTGSQVQYLAADGGPEFKPLRSMEIGTKDVRLVRLYATTTNRPLLFDVRFSDLDIIADQVVRANSQPAHPAGPPEEPASGKGFTPAVILNLLFLIALGSGFVLWFAVRRRREAARGDTAAPVIFACAACGKSLRVKAGLAGKRVKCPGCGAAMPVPAADVA
jgi:serine/threonine protein kinase